MLTLGSLFSGIGGLELGLEWSGLGRVVWQVEINDYRRRVLAKHWPHVDRSVTDVRRASPGRLAPVRALCGGFPCPDLSSAGKRAGLAGARSGLWYEYRRCIDEFRPVVAIVENVTSGEGRWLPFIEADLAALGYRTEVLRLTGFDVGAPHRRARTFVLAYAHEGGRSSLGRSGQLDGRERPEFGDDAHGRGGAGGAQDVRWAPAQPEVGRGAHGLPAGVVGDRGDRAIRPVCWPAGRGEPQHGWEPPRAIRSGSVAHHVPRLGALGDAVMPHVAERVGRRVIEVLGERLAA